MYREWEGVRIMTDPVRMFILLDLLPFSLPCLFYCPHLLTILELQSIRRGLCVSNISADGLQNFLHAGDHVHLGPGVTGTRLTNPAVDLHELPRIDLVCLSHYHA